MNLNDIEFRYSGGAANADPSLSLGGAMSSEIVPSNSLANLFSEVALAESEFGLVDYRCIYVLNTHASDTLAIGAANTQLPPDQAGASIAMGLDPAGVNADAQAIAYSTAVPVGVAFLAYPPSGAGLDLGDLGPSDFIAVWIRRTIPANTNVPTSDEFTLRISGIPITGEISPTSP
jgi:hypothetical protein